MGLKKNKNYIVYFSISFLVVIGSIFFISGKNITCSGKQPSTNFKIIKSFPLPDELYETSGIIFFNNLLWSFNDSGGEPELYAWRESDSTLIKRVTLWNAYNFDWEDIAQDSAYVYVGDIGNNFGNRNNLCIYRIEKAKLLKDGNQALKAEKIQFTYPGYNAASYLTFNPSSFDCEALVCFNDSLFLFTKDWNKGITIVYSLPSKPGSYTAKKISEYNVDGLITAADYNGKHLILLGYNEFVPFIWYFNHISNFNLAIQEGKKFVFTELSNAQTEGVCFKNDTLIYISNEKSGIGQSVWLLQIQ